MKRCLTSAVFSLLFLCHAQAELLFSDDFDYPDGNLIGAAGSPWLPHSGAGSNAVQVSSGRAVITGGGSTREDVNVLLPGAPFEPGEVNNLYAGFTLNCTALPNTTGTYFAHFQFGTNIFRGRLWASTSGAASGRFRLSIGNSAGASATTGQLAQDLQTNTHYRVTIRYNVTTGRSTLWLNPTDENTGGVNAGDLAGITALERFGFRQGLTSTDGSSGTIQVDNLLIGTSFTDVLVLDAPPTISSLPPQEIFVNGTTGPLGFTIGDDQTPVEALELSRGSDNQTLLPLSGIVLGGAGANRTVTITPAGNQTGTATVTLFVSDGTSTTSTSFLVTVVDNVPPTISAIANQQLVVDTSTGPLAFTIGDNLVPAADLTLGKASDNLALVPLNNIVFGGAGADRTVTVTPAAGQTGTATITITVSDGDNEVDTAFQVTVVNNLPPGITGIANQQIFVNGGTGPLTFTVNDDLTPAQDLVLARDSDNLTLVPLNGIVFGGGGASRTVTVTPAVNRVGTATITVTVSDGTSATPTSFLLTVIDNQPPTISAIADQTLAANNTTGPLPFTINDGVVPAASLTLGKNSDNLTLVPLNNIVFGGSGSSRTVTVTPVTGQQGSALITVSVSDGSNMANRVFRVTVGVPAIAPVLNQFTPAGTALGPVPIIVSHGALDPAQLQLTAQSSNDSVIPDGNLVLGGSGASRTLTATPAAGQTGVTTIMLNASDGIQSVQQAFSITVHPYLGLLFSDDFSREEEGPVVDNALWYTHAGTPGETFILLNKLELSQAQSEDFHRRLHPTLNFAPAAGHVLYASFQVNFSALPTGSGNYFAHFNTNGFRARVFARTNFAAADKFRLGIANATANLPNDAVLARDLSLNENYLVALRHNVATGESYLWVNPVSQFDAGVAATDAPQPVTLDTFAFRQSDPGNPLGIGTLTVDNLKVGTAFADVVDPAPTLGHTRLGNTLRLSWPTGGGYLLRRADQLPVAGWNNVPFTTGSPDDFADIDITSGAGVFRLEK